jgi:hypothetical protein
MMKTGDPQDGQKARRILLPLSAVASYQFGSPHSNVKFSPLNSTAGKKALPVARWQSRQWQLPI